MHKDVRKLVRELRREGYTVIESGHHLPVLLDGRRVGTLPCSPSDHRSLLNTRRDIRRATAELRI